MINKGSEWNRWDLHFHTPSSYDYKDKTVSSRDIVDEMIRNNISVFAVTDHHIIDVERYNEIKLIGEEKGVTVLPGIEFLSDSRGRDPVHFIGVFSESCDVEFVWGQIQNRTKIADVKGSGMKVNEVYCDLPETIKIIKELGGIVTIHAGDKSNSVENITHSLPHGAAQKTEIAKSVDIYELGKESDQDGYRDIVFPAIGKNIPMIICSDNHDINNYQIKQKLWIKGSPNFEGLKYALSEPDERFYIGDEPEVIGRIKGNKTKYIRELQIRRTGRLDAENVWFEDVIIPINGELVTIIGNKGSGKSALADIVALCCDAEHAGDYLFLHKSKFKRKGLADRFSASVVFASGTNTGSKQLDYEVPQSEQPLVRYLPQSYFEKVCNEIGKVEALRSEIEKVVFQYVPQNKRMQKESFRELVEFRKEAVEKEIYHLIEGIHEVNSRIISLEDKCDPDYRKNLLSKKKHKEDELKAHVDEIPLTVENPAVRDKSPEAVKRKEALDALLEKKDKLGVELNNIRSNVTNCALQIEELQSIKREVRFRCQELNAFVDEEGVRTQALGVNLRDVIKIEFDEGAFEQAIKSLVDRLGESEKELVLDDEFKSKKHEELNALSRYERMAHEIKDLQSKFSGEQLRYQKYLDEMIQWEKTKSEITGDKDKVDSLAHIEASIEYVEKQLPADLLKLRSQRKDLSLDIFRRKSEIKQIYDETKKEIDEKLSGSSVTGLSIESSFYTSSSCEASILNNIRQNRTGSFYGSEDGRMLLHDELIMPTDWNAAEDVGKFLDKIIEYLENDMRKGIGKGSATFIGDLVKDRVELYNYIFSLNYLNPHYDLRQNGKSLEQLSPGEKGALLLVFYLVLDKDDIPLIIDQPEDNLDNNSVAKVLVPYIREAKKNRQIIMVSHNPNLAVVSDSEQVIRVAIDKEGGNRFSCVCGGIENSKVNGEIVDVLEGTMPAFTTRKIKYTNHS